MVVRHLILVSLASLAIQTASAETVCSIHDGDTLKTCDGVSVRVWGIDAPELKQPGGKEARGALAGMVAGSSVRLDCVDKSYNRKVCRVYRGPVDVSRAMVRAGWAFDEKRFSRNLYDAPETQAKMDRLGLWKMPDGGERPWIYRHSKQKQ